MRLDEFLEGARGCREGVQHKSGKSKDYDRGYSAQYQHEQNLTGIHEMADTILRAGAPYGQSQKDAAASRSRLVNGDKYRAK